MKNKFKELCKQIFDYIKNNPTKEFKITELYEELIDKELIDKDISLEECSEAIRSLESRGYIKFPSKPEYFQGMCMLFKADILKELE